MAPSDPFDSFAPPTVAGLPPAGRSGRRYRKPGSAVKTLALAALVGLGGLGVFVLALYLGPLAQREPPATIVDHKSPSAPVPAARVVALPAESQVHAVTNNTARRSAAQPPPQSAPAGGPETLLPKPLAEVTLPEPIDGLGNFAGDKKTVHDLVFTACAVPAGRAAPQLCWNAGANGFYYLDAAGFLRLISYPTLREERLVQLGHAAGRLAVGEEGLLVTLPKLQELWVLHPVGLNVTHRVGIAGVREVLGAPALKQALAFGEQGGPAVVEFEGDTGRLNAAAVERQEPSSLPPGLGGFGQPAVSPDGKYLFTLGTGEQILRYRIEGRALFLEDASPRVAVGTKRPLCLSPDGQYVCAPCPSGNLNAGEHGTLVFKAMNLSAPALTLASGPFPQAVGFDPTAGLAYAQSARFPLLAFDLTGAKKGEYAVGAGAAAPAVQQILVHPAGRKMLLLTESKLYAVAPAGEK
jgi:hypothetical protein